MGKRRLNNEGSLKLRKDGLWVARVSHEGKRIAAYGHTKEEARQKLRSLQRKQDQGLPLVTSQMSLREYLKQWLDSITHLVRRKTLVDYEVAVRLHIVPSLGHIRLDKLTPEHVDKAWTAMLRDDASASVVQYAHLRLSKALNDAMKRNLIFRNPCQGVSPPRVGGKELHPPDAHAIHLLLKEARDTEYYEAMYPAFYTGLRRGEVLGLRWRDLDLDLATISVNRSIYRGKGGDSIYQDPKTAKGRRLVSLTPSTALMLHSLRERQQADGLLLGYAINDG